MNIITAEQAREMTNLIVQNEIIEYVMKCIKREAFLKNNRIIFRKQYTPKKYYEAITSNWFKSNIESLGYKYKYEYYADWKVSPENPVDMVIISW